MTLLNHYLQAFAHLHRNQNTRLGHAPHKPILLLAILHQIECGTIGENLIPISPDLVAAFRAYWRMLVPPDTWQERLILPFRYLIYDGFWNLVKDGRPLTAGELGHITSIHYLATVVDGGRFVPELYQLLQHGQTRTALRAHLLDTYFPEGQAALGVHLPARPLDYEAERLFAQAKARFRPNAVRETDEDGSYVRHALFPQVIRSLYHDACAVNRLDTRDDRGVTLVEAAHITPFSRFYYDDPPNGLALCPNHHCGVDNGQFSIAETLPFWHPLGYRVP